MTARMLPSGADGIGRGAERPVRIVVDGEQILGVLGQSIAGVLLASDRIAWRSTARDGAPRGLFCGIGVCFDCLVEVDGVADVRACQRRAVDGARVRTTPQEADPCPDPAPSTGTDHARRDRDGAP